LSTDCDCSLSAACPAGRSGTYTNAASGITRPEELRGATVGVAEYQLTANVWIRGILAEHYGYVI
jgi:4,5-dihydroxyphthalate decarboxylase